MLIGKKIGRYEIRSKIGAGGMGEVYLAYDAELDRNVAVKILPLEFSDDEHRKSRFRQEARAVSALNHPNIITIHEIGENEHGSFLATEFVEGETLREIIKNRALNIPAILKIIEQVAKALVAAHHAHIVHRDIKPENIVMRTDGIVKVLDFGLAKPTIQNDETDDETVKTIPGVVLGSARYMSPEQARGLTVDERTDIWSLGVILYEMLTRNAPFNGATTTDTIAAVIYKEPPPIASYIQNAPAELGRIIRKALQKDREERYQTVKDFALDIKDLLYEIEYNDSGEKKYAVPTGGSFSENATMIHQTTSGSHPTQIHQTNSANHPTKTSVIPTSDLSAANEKPKNHGRQMLFASLAAIVLIVLVGLTYSFYHSQKTETDSDSAFEKNRVSRISSDGKVALPAISPDGKYMAYAGGEAGSRNLIVRQISTDSLITIVPPTNLDLRSIAFSPAGDYIFYTQIREDFSLNTLYKVPTLGGTSKKLIEDVDSPVTFSPDGKQFAFVRHTSNKGEDLIFISDTDEPNPQRLLGSVEAGFNSFTKHLAWSPDGKQMLVGAGKTRNGYDGEIKIGTVSITDKKLQILPLQNFYLADNFCWLKDGSGFLFVAQETRNSPYQIWRASAAGDKAQAITNDFNNYTELGLSADGKTIVTVKGETVSSLWRFAPSTKENMQVSAESRNLEGAFGVTQMPDGKLFLSRSSERKVDFEITGADGKNPQIITADLPSIYSPVISPNGRYIVFSSDKSKTVRIWRTDADGKNPVKLTEETSDYGDFNPQITPDGKTVIYQRSSNGNERSDLMKVSIDGGQSSPFYTNSQTNTGQPHLAPDGKTIAFSEYDVNTFDKHLIIASVNGEVFGKIEKTLEYNLINLISWSPDSKSLTISSIQKGVPNIFRLPLDGSPQQPLTDFKSGKILNFAWSNDGKNLFIVRGITNNDLILIRDAGGDGGK